jgi:signal peptidase I
VTFARLSVDGVGATYERLRGRPFSAARDAAASTGRWLWEWTKSLLIAFALFLIIRTFVVEAFRIPTGSMEQTLLVGDFLLVNKAVYGAQVPGTGRRLPGFDEPRRGDVIVFLPPHEPDKNYVKRLVGLPGDTLMMRDKILYVNGEPQEEPYAQYTDSRDMAVPHMAWQRDYVIGIDPMRYRPTRDNWGPIVVPENRYFVLGDNRANSSDSRASLGFVPRDHIVGRAVVVIWPLDHAGFLTGIRHDLAYDQEPQGVR